MAITLNGTTGINTPGVVNTAAETIATTLAVTGVTTIAAGSAAAPALVGTTGGATTGVWFPGASTIAFANAGVESARINSAGDLRLGSLAITQGNADAKSSIYGGTTDSSPCLELFKGSTTSNPNQVFMRFQTSQATTAAASGSITANGVSNVGFTTWSDRRRKENIVDLPSQLANIMALRPVEFDYKGYENGEGHQLGFIAQEVQEIYPDLVSEGADGMLTLTDMNKNDARLIKAVQEMKAIIDTQASTITAMTARITALEAR